MTDFTYLDDMLKEVQALIVEDAVWKVTVMDGSGTWIWERLGVRHPMVGRP